MPLAIGKKLNPKFILHFFHFFLIKKLQKHSARLIFSFTANNKISHFLKFSLFFFLNMFFQQHSI